MLVLVDGAMCHRGFGPAEPFTAALRDAYTVVTYDRRGRGESGDSSTYRPELEVDDLRAVIETVGGKPYVLGFSSGAGLAYRAAARRRADVEAHRLRGAVRRTAAAAATTSPTSTGSSPRAGTARRSTTSW